MRKLRSALNDYLTIRRQLGFKLRDEGSILPKFILFIEQHGASFITRDLAQRWAMQPKDVLPSWWAKRLCMVRGFAQYLSVVDSRTEVPPQGLLPYRYRRRSPYIYSNEEIEHLIEAAKQLPSLIGLRPYTYSTLFGLIAVTGMRMRESIRLKCEDVDSENGVLTIYDTKFGKSRLIPIHPSTQRALDQYQSKRNQIYPNPIDPNLFISDQGRRLVGSTVRRTFIKLSRQIGLRAVSDSHGPRLHDFRHTFAVRTILNWYRSGGDVERQIPKLATYLGHTHVNDTYWYLSAVPELMQLAAMRLEQR
jgi:integrase/recombinase XerD